MFCFLDKSGGLGSQIFDTSRDVCFFYAEYEPLIPPNSPAAEAVNIPKIFGATSDDTDRLRIVSLYEVGLLSGVSGSRD